MSSVFKGIKKVFKKVVKAVKKIAVPVLAIGALVFTGGAALGLGGIMGGGWGAAAQLVTAKLGAGGILGSALTGAITQAGTGALIGGAIAGVTGGSVSDGMKAGAGAGAITGGLMGTMSGMRQASAAAGGGTVTTHPYNPEQLGAGEFIDAAGNPIGSGPPPPVSAAVGGATQAAGGSGAGGDLLSRAAGWVEKHPTLAGGAIRGLGQGLMAAGAADADKELLQERHRLTSANYAGSDPGAQYRNAAQVNSGPTPTERFDPAQYGAWEYVYDPKQRRIVRQATT